MTKYLSIYLSLSLSLSGHPSCSKSTSKGWPTRPDNTVLSGLWRRVTAHWRWRARACHELPTTVEVQVVIASLSLSQFMEQFAKVLLSCCFCQSSHQNGLGILSPTRPFVKNIERKTLNGFPFNFHAFFLSLLPIKRKNTYPKTHTGKTHLTTLNYANWQIMAMLKLEVWCPHSTQRTFDEMPDENTVSRNCVIDGYSSSDMQENSFFFPVRWEICCLDLCRFLVFQMPSNGFGGESSVFRRRYLGFVRRRKRRGQKSRSDSRKYQIATVGRNS